MQTIIREVDTIKMKDTRQLFTTTRGLPRKECLRTLVDLYTEQRIPLSDDPIIKSYQMHTGAAVLGALRKYFRNHHCLWIDPKLGKYVYHGFSQDKDKQANSQNRFDGFAAAQRISADQHQQLMEDRKNLLE